MLEEHFRSSLVFRMTGDEYLVAVEDATYDTFIKSVNDAHHKLDNISLGLVSVGYAWEKVDIDAEKLIGRAEGMMREEKQKYYKNLIMSLSSNRICSAI